MRSLIQSAAIATWVVLFAPLASHAAESLIRVRVFDGVNRLTLRNAIPDGAGTHLGEVHWNVECKKDKVHWKPAEDKSFEATSVDRRFDRAQIRFEHSEQGAGTVAAESGGKALKLPGTIEILATSDACLVINTLPLNRYLEGVLSAEVGAAWPAAALEAQAVAARSYTLSMQQESRRRQRAYDLESSTQDQVYAGMSRGTQTIHKAIEKTAGWQLVEKTDSGASIPARAYYHSTCGGSTDTPSAIWKGRSGLAAARICAHCEASPQFRWRYETTWKDLAAKLQGAKILKATQHLTGLIPLQTLPSGRHQKVRLLMGDATKEISGTVLRQTVGNERIRSTRFTIEKPDAEHVTFVGRGFGHGVGLCQWGAKGMAAAGKSSEEILQFYYPYLRLLR